MLKTVLSFLRGNWQLALILAIVGVTAATQFQNQRLRSQLRDTRIAALNERARAGQAIDLAAGAVVRLAFQNRITAGVLARNAELEVIAAEAVARVDFDSVFVQDTIVVVDSANVRYGRFDVYEEPVRVAGEVSLPPPPLAGRVDLVATVDPFEILVNVGCRRTGDSVSEALVGIQGPEWAKIHLSAPTVSVDVCNPPVKSTSIYAPRSFLSQALWVPVGAVAGAVGSLVTGGNVGRGALAGGGVGVTLAILF
jgi:uncharacterized membrane protein